MPYPPPPGKPKRVLVVDDDPELLDLLVGALRQEGWAVTGAATGREAVAACARCRPDAIVLDMMLPDMDGLEVLRRIQAAQPQVRVMFLTARDSTEDKIGGIAAGGDGYLTKPFSLAELAARLHGLMRRAGPREAPADEGGVLSLADLVLDERSHEVSRAGRQIELSRTEYTLLRYLLLHPRQVLSRQQIMEAVWSYDFGRQAHVVELYISYLRKKIDHGRAPLIHTVRGAGYLIKDPGLHRVPVM